MRTSGTEASPAPRAWRALGGCLAGAGFLVGVAHVGIGGALTSGPASPQAIPSPPDPSASADTVLPWEVEGDPASDDAVERGAYLARAGNCIACHTVEDPEPEDYLAGGNPIASPFGTFYGTNITPHPEEGIGEWELEDLERALREGRAPDRSRFYPVFPYTAFTGMRDEDVADLHAFLQAIPARDRENRSHDLAWFALRGGLGLWASLHFDEGRFQEDPERGERWNRGAYLTRAVAHCAECHSPRTRTGGIDEDLRYAGTREPPGEDETIPNITPHPETGIGDWSPRELVRYLQMGMDPDGDFAGGSMGEVISEGTSHLTDEDLEAIAEYILSLEPVHHDVD